MQQCLGESTDPLVRAMGAKQPCSKNEWHHDGDRLVTETVCTYLGSVTTTRGVFTGDLTTAYHGEITITYDPPMFGLGRSKTIQQAHWVGPCKAGMKPDDMLCPTDGS